MHRQTTLTFELVGCKPGLDAGAVCIVNGASRIRCMVALASETHKVHEAVDLQHKHPEQGSCCRTLAAICTQSTRLTWKVLPLICVFGHPPSVDPSRMAPEERHHAKLIMLSKQSPTSQTVEQSWAYCALREPHRQSLRSCCQ